MRLAGNRAEVGRNAALNRDSSQSQTMRFNNWEIQSAAGTWRGRMKLEVAREFVDRKLAPGAGDSAFTVGAAIVWLHPPKTMG